MQWWKRSLNFLLFSNIYLAIIIALACYATCITFNVHAPILFFAFIICSTCSSYCMHWALPVPSAQLSIRELWSKLNTRFLVALAIANFILGLYFFSRLPSGAFYYIMPLVLFTFIYTAPKINVKPFILLKKLVVAKTMYLSLVLTYATVFLPMLLYNIDCNMQLLLYALMRLAIIYIICLLFDYRDRHTDACKGLSQYISDMEPYKLMTILQVELVALSLLSFIVVKKFPANMQLGLAVQFITPCMALSLLLRKSIYSSNTYLYYGILDGLLAVHAVALFL